MKKGCCLALSIGGVNKKGRQTERKNCRFFFIAWRQNAKLDVAFGGSWRSWRSLGHLWRMNGLMPASIRESTQTNHSNATITH
jgi:hypothetical protein